MSICQTTKNLPSFSRLHACKFFVQNKSHAMAKISQNIQIAFIARLYLQLCISYSLRGIENYILLLIYSKVICQIVKLITLRLKLILKVEALPSSRG